MYIGRRWLSSHLDRQNTIAADHQWRQNYSTRRQFQISIAQISVIASRWSPGSVAECGYLSPVRLQTNGTEECLS